MSANYCAMPVSRVYHLDRYSIPELLQLLHTERGERVRLDTRSQPCLTIKGQDFEIDGPPIEEDAAEEMLRPIADTRQVRAFRRFSTVNIVHTFKGKRYLIRVVRAFGTFNVELHAIKD